MAVRPPQAALRPQATGPQRPPRLAIFEALNAQLHPPEVNEDEQIWRDRYTFFLGRGYQLRPRYAPGWIPSWIGTDIDPFYCEDAVEQIVCHSTKTDSINLSER